MKKRFFTILAVLAILSLALLGCPTGSDGDGDGDGNTPGGDGGSKSKAATLTLLKFDDTQVSTGTAITSTAWGTLADLDSLTSAQEATFQLTAASRDIAITTTASEKATVKIAATTDVTKPASFAAAGATTTITAGGYLIIQVTAEDTTVVNYYAVKIELTGSNTTLSGLKIGNGESISGTAKNTLAELVLAEINLQADMATNATVTLELPTAFKGVASIAKLADGTNLPADTDFTVYNASSKPPFTFADGDRIYVKMLAENGVTTRYYGYVVYIGRDARMDGFDFVDNATNLAVTDRVDVTEAAGKASVAAITEADWGQIMFNVTGNAFKVTAVPVDDGATALISTDGTNFEAISNGGLITFLTADGAENFVYVQVTSQNTKVVLYYKYKVVLQRSVTIPYATVTPTIPPTLDASAINDIKTWWENPANATAWLPINRQNKTETGMGNAYDNLAQDQRTFGRAKLSWDTKGIWVYAQVYETNITEMTGTSNMHTVSSVELFINEAYSAGVTTGSVTGSSPYGGQYRLGTNEARSGDPTAATTAFSALGNFKAAKWTDGSFKSVVEPFQDTGVTNGYVMIFQAPWRYTDRYPLVNNKKISIELQINAIGPNQGDGRIAVLNWNNENSNSYNSLANFGEAILFTSTELPAVQPNITTQPTAEGATGAVKVDLGEDNVELFAVAATSDGGTLSFQWYKAANSTAAPATDTAVGTADPGTPGTPAGGVTPYTSKYTPDISTDVVSDNYYYVVVSNTKGGTTETRVSNVVSYRIIDPDDEATDIELVGPGVLFATDGTTDLYDATAGGFVFTATGGWGNYSFITGSDITVTTAFDGDSYSKIVMVYTGYLAGAATPRYDQATTSTWSNNAGSPRYGLDFGVNISGTAATAWNNADAATIDNSGFVTAEWGSNLLTASMLFSNGSSKIAAYSMNKANGTAKIEKLVIKSIKLIAK